VNPADQARRRFVQAGLAAGVAGAAGAAGAGVPVAAAPATSPILVLNSQDADVAVIDAARFEIVKRVPTGKEPHHLYLTPDRKSVIVANAASNSLTFLDPATGEVQRTLRDVVDPYHLRFSPDMAWFVTAANRLNHVDLYRWAGADAAVPLQFGKRIAAPKTPSHLSIDSRSKVVYASLQDSDELLAIDLATQAVRWKVGCGRMPADVFLTADDRTLLVGLTGDKVVEAWDVSGAQPKLAKRVVTGNGAHAFRARGDARHVFVSNRVANTVSEIDTQRLDVVAEYAAPGGPDCMEMLKDGRTLLVTARWARKLIAIDTVARQVVRQLAVGRSPHGVWTLDHAPRV
jgi:DNA-binding beta-propeller fold protein YncE